MLAEKSSILTNNLIKINQIRTILNAVVLERQEETDGILLSVLSGCNTLFLGEPGTAKCRTREAVICTDTGFQTLKEIFRDFDVEFSNKETIVEVKNLKTNSSFGMKKVQALYSKTTKNVVEVRSMCAPIIRGTENHPVRVLTSSGLVWKELSELQMGDILVGKLSSLWTGCSLDLLKPASHIVKALHSSEPSNKSIIYKTPKALSLELSRLLGYLVADGHLRNYSVGLSTGNKNVYDDFKHCLTTCFPDINFHEKMDRGLFCIKITSKYLHVWLTEACGFTETDNALAESKQVPEIIRLAPKKFVKEFLRGYLSCDSSFSENSVKIVSASEDLIRQLITILTHFNVAPSRVRDFKACAENGTKIKKHYFSATFSFQYCYDLFQSLNLLKPIPDWKPEQDQRRLPNVCTVAWQTLCSAFSTVNNNSTVVCLQNGKILKSSRRELINKKWKARDFYPKIVTRRLFESVNWDFAKTIDLEATHTLQFCLDETYWFSEVSSTKTIKEKTRVYDISVPEVQEFLADGLINHNTFHIQLASTLLGLSNFDILLSETVKPDQIFGPTDIPALAQGKQQTKYVGYAPDCEILFFDEIFKANATVLNPLLWLINEHLFRDGDNGIVKCKVMTTFAASNELPNDPLLAAIYDRFLLRFKVEYLKSEHSTKKLIKKSLTSRDEFVPILSVSEVESLRNFTRQVEFPEDMQELAMKIRRQVEYTLGYKISDRRFIQSIRVIQASAILNDRMTVMSQDLEVLVNILWNEPSQIPKIQSIVYSSTSGDIIEISTYVEQANSIKETLKDGVGLKEKLIQLKKLYTLTKGFKSRYAIQATAEIKSIGLIAQHLVRERKEFTCVRISSNIVPYLKLTHATASVWSTKELRAFGFQYKRKGNYWYYNKSIAVLRNTLKNLSVNFKISTPVRTDEN